MDFVVYVITKERPTYEVVLKGRTARLFINRTERQAWVGVRYRRHPWPQNLEIRPLPNGRPSRGKDASVAEVKALFLHGTLEAVKEIWKFMTHSRSESLRLAPSQLWLDRALGKVPNVIEGPGGSQVTFNIISGVPEPDDEPRVIDMPRIPTIYRKTSDG